MLFFLHRTTKFSFLFPFFFQCFLNTFFYNLLVLFNFNFVLCCTQITIQSKQYLIRNQSEKEKVKRSLWSIIRLGAPKREGVVLSNCPVKLFNFLFLNKKTVFFLFFCFFPFMCLRAFDTVVLDCMCVLFPECYDLVALNTVRQRGSERERAMRVGCILVLYTKNM